MQESIDVRPYFATVLARWRLIVSLAILTMAAALLFSALQPRHYEASAGLLILRSRTAASFDSNIETISEADLTLDRTARRRSIAALISTPDVERRVVAALQQAGESPSDRPGALLGRITVTVGQADVIEIAASGGSAEGAARLANVWAEIAADYINEVYQTPEVTMAEGVAQEIAAARERYNTAAGALATFQGSSNVAALRAQVGAFEQTLAYQSQRHLERTQLLERAELLLAQLDAGDEAVDAIGAAVGVLLAQATMYTPVTTHLSGAVTGTLQIQQPASAQLQLIVPGSRADREGLTAQLEGLVSALRSQQERDFEISPEAEAVRQLQTAQAELTREEEQLHQLTEARNIARETYENLMRRAEEININREVPASEVRFALSAMTPAGPTNSSMLRAAIVGLLAGLVLGLVGAFLTDMVAGGSQRLNPARLG